MLPSGTEPLRRPELFDDADLLVGDGAHRQPGEHEGEERDQADRGDDQKERRKRLRKIVRGDEGQKGVHRDTFSCVPATGRGGRWIRFYILILFSRRDLGGNAKAVSRSSSRVLRKDMASPQRQARARPALAWRMRARGRGEDTISGLRRPRRQHPLQLAHVGRLGEVVIEPGLLAAAAVVLAVVPGQGHEQHAARNAAPVAAAGPPRSRPARAARCPTAPRPAPNPRARSTPSAPREGHAHLVAEDLQQHPQALGGVVVVLDDQHARPRSARSAGRLRPPATAPAAPAPAAGGS